MGQKTDAAKRIVVYGVTGSGKTHLAKRIASATGLPYTAVDDLTWEPGWKYVDFDEQRRIFREICSREEWILDNAYGHWIEIPLERVELIVALDYPRWVSFGRLLRRTLGRVRSKERVCNGNVETPKELFSRESILLWHFKSFKRKRATIRRWIGQGRPVVLLRSPEEAERWLASFEKPC